MTRGGGKNAPESAKSAPPDRGRCVAVKTLFFGGERCLPNDEQNRWRKPIVARKAWRKRQKFSLVSVPFNSLSMLVRWRQNTITANSVTVRNSVVFDAYCKSATPQSTSVALNDPRDA